MNRHYVEFKNDLDKQFGFDFFESLYQVDSDFGTDHMDMSELTLEFFIKQTSGNEYLEYLKKDRERYLVWINMVLMTYHYFKNQKKHFDLSADVTNLLLQTDMKDVHVQFLKLPFQTIYLTVPKGMFNGSAQGKTVEIEGIYVHQYNLRPYSQKELTQLVGKGIISYIQLGLVMKSEGEYRYGTIHLKFKNGNVREQLKDNYNRAGLQFEELATDVFALVLNTLFYIQTDTADVEFVEPTKPLLVVQKPVPADKRAGHYRIGRKIVIEPNLKKRLNEHKRSPLKTEKEYGWLVRGHWRNQPVGKGRKERKLIWIEPHLKGNKEGPILSKDYEIKK